MKLFILFPDSVFAFFLFQFRKNPRSWSVKRQIVGKGVGVESSFIFFWIVRRLTTTPFSGPYLLSFLTYLSLFGAFSISFSLAILYRQTSESETYLTFPPPLHLSRANKNLVAQLYDLFIVDRLFLVYIKNVLYCE